MKTIMIISVALIIEVRISLDPSKTTCIADFCSDSGSLAFSRSRLNTFSTSMIASSTITPMAIAIPPRVMVLMVISKNSNTNTEVISASGMAVREIIVVRKFARKSSRIITTSIAPSRRASITLSMARSIKSACRKMWLLIVNPSGRFCSIWASVSSTRSVSSRVLVSGCFLIEIITA